MKPHLSDRYCEKKREAIHRQLREEIEQVRNSDFIGEVLANAMELAFAELVNDSMRAG